MSNKKLSLKFRILHRYLGFFLAGVMAIYAISGVIMIFRETNFLKKETVETRQLEAHVRDQGAQDVPDPAQDQRPAES